MDCKKISLHFDLNDEYESKEFRAALIAGRLDLIIKTYNRYINDPKNDFSLGGDAKDFWNSLVENLELDT